MARTTLTVLVAVGMLAASLALATPAAAAHSQYDRWITSFDGTQIRVTIFQPEGSSPSNPVPYVLMTHGWAGTRVTEQTGRVLDLLDAGYGVVTWDSRGFGESGGSVQLNSPDYEVKDVDAIITHLTQYVGSVQKVGSDPVIGMSGGSYAGGIQLLAAAFDDRIDAIAPEITWNDLVQSLAPNGVPKLYWTTLLFAAGAEASCVNARNGGAAPALFAGLRPTDPNSEAGCQTSDLARYYAEVHATNEISDEVRDALLARSPATYMSEIDIPTLLVQGFPDTLFDVDQAVANYEGIKANGAPVKLWLYDGGHGHPEGPALPNTQGELISSVVVNWFDRHLKGDTTVDTGAEVEWFDGEAWHASAAWPPAELTTSTVPINGIPTLAQAPVTGGNQGIVHWKLADGPLTVGGEASVSFDITGVGSEGFVFVSLGVMTGTTVARLADQTQPVRTPISSSTPTPIDLDLVDVAGQVPEGSTLVITFASSDRNYNGNRAPGYVNMENVAVEYASL